MVNGTGNFTLSGSIEFKQESSVFEYIAELSMTEKNSVNYTAWIFCSYVCDPPAIINLTFTNRMGSDVASSCHVDRINIIPEEGWQVVTVMEEIDTT